MSMLPSSSSQTDSTAPSAVPKQRSLLGKLVRIFAWTGIFGTTAVVSAVAGAAFILTVPLPKGLGEATANPPLSELWKSGFRYQVSRPVTLLLMGLDEA
ncbi:MAG: LytR family transcriptional regulator, partial [Cyanobacteria bacterium P01_C01_bin.118]